MLLFKIFVQYTLCAYFHDFKIRLEVNLISNNGYFHLVRYIEICMKGYPNNKIINFYHNIAIVRRLGKHHTTSFKKKKITLK